MARIFLIDDDRDLPELIKTILTEKGYAVYIFHEAESAMTEIRVRKPDLIIMDMMLPGMGGADAIREIKRDPKFKDIPVVFLTGLVSSKDQELLAEGLTVDGLNYATLGKPFEKAVLLQTVQSMLRKKS